MLVLNKRDILQNWNISSTDTLKLKNILTIDIFKPLGLSF